MIIMVFYLTCSFCGRLALDGNIYINTLYTERTAIYGYGLVGCKAVCFGT